MQRFSKNIGGGARLRGFFILGRVGVGAANRAHSLVTYLWFVPVLLVTGGIAGLLRVGGIRADFSRPSAPADLRHDASDTYARRISLVDVGDCGGLDGFGCPDIAGVDMSVISRSYELMGLLAMAAAPMCIAAVPWFEYVLLVYREGDGCDL